MSRSSFIVALALVIVVQAQDRIVFGQIRLGNWVGSSVMPKQGIKYRMGDQDLAQPLPLPLEVYAEEGQWLCVPGGKVRKSDVVPVSEAAAYYERLLKADAKNSWALCQRGILLGTDGELDKALHDFDLAIQYDPKNAEAYVMRGVLHATNEEYDRAMEQFNQAIAIRPDYADAYHQRGNSYFEDFDDDDKAIADFETAIKVCPQFSEAYAGRGLAYQYLGRSKEALADYDKVLTFDAYNVDCWSNRALIRAACPDATLRNGKLALQDARRACELTKNEDPETLVVLAAAHAEAGEFDQAIKVQMQAVLKTKGKGNLELLKTAGLYKQKQPFRYETKAAN